MVVRLLVSQGFLDIYQTKLYFIQKVTRFFTFVLMEKTCTFCFTFCQACSALVTAFKKSRCPPMCCSDDFCNTQCGAVNHTIASTPKPYITTTRLAVAQTSGSGSEMTTVNIKPTSLAGATSQVAGKRHRVNVYISPLHPCLTTWRNDPKTLQHI